MDFHFRPPRRSMTRPNENKRRFLPNFESLRFAPAAAALCARVRKHRWLIFTLGTVALLLTGLTLLRHMVSLTEARMAPPEVTAAPPPVLKPQKEIIEGEIQPGDTISALLGKYFSDQELHSLTTESRKVFPLSGICSGQPYKLCVNDGNFERFEYDINRDEQLIIRKESEGFDINRLPIAYTVKEEVVRGSITSSLFEAVSGAGETDALAVMLADIFAYDIDFIRDIRTGDSFQVLVEKRFREGKPGGYGRILGATFTNQGVTYTAFLFKDGKNPPSYYAADGKALRKAFLKAPLAFSRISSGFTMKRFHPITRTWKAHPAIDYAAPTGTPIMAIGDGTIIKIGRAGGNGNHVKLRHNNGIDSLYLHMSRFAKGMRQGKRVVQGQVIGFVGSTGLATGPHLCFRMYKNGAPLNPSKLRTAAAAPISREHMAEFRAAIDPRLARLEGRDIQQAKLEPAPAAASGR
jgi:murein DD-endopeptidase MepM/ murein hydrolase activator NlpD